jgi:hypothetical protein
MHRAWEHPLEQLALSEHDHRFVADTAGDVVVAFDRSPRADETDEQERTPREERAGDGERRRERNRAGERCYSRAFLSSAEIAGTISCKLPITA